MDPARVIADLRELDRRTGGPGGRAAGVLDRRVGARRATSCASCWSRCRSRSRSTRRATSGPTLAGRSDEGSVAIGSHLDSVPAGGWLDGALGVMARRGGAAVAAAAGRPRRTVALVDWADEEGARFGRSLLGSSAFAGTLDAEAVRGLIDADGVTAARRRSPPTASTSRRWTRRATGAASAWRLPRAAHRAGPGAGGRGAGVRRRARHASGSSATGWSSPAAPAHAGIDADGPPRRRRRGRGPHRRRAAGDRARVTAASARRAGSTSTRASSPPCRGAPTLLVDQRHLDAGALARDARRRRASCGRARPRRRAAWSRPSGSGRSSRCRSTRAWSTPRARRARAAGGTAERAAERRPARRRPSWRASCPRRWSSAPRRDGVSHAPGEDTPEADLAARPSPPSGRCARG